jgi:hypothetical protein
MSAIFCLRLSTQLRASGIGERVNKTENAFSPLPIRTKASNADMTACLPLQACIVQTTSLPAGNFCSRAACILAPLHGSCPAAVAGSQNA